MLLVSGHWNKLTKNMQVNCRPFIQFIQCVQTNKPTLTRLSLWRGVYPRQKETLGNVSTIMSTHNYFAGCAPWVLTGVGIHIPDQKVAAQQPARRPRLNWFVRVNLKRTSWIPSWKFPSASRACKNSKTHSHPRRHRLHCRQTSCIQWPARVLSACTCHRTVFSTAQCIVHVLATLRNTLVIYSYM